jgi:hypothetical protein
MVRKKAKTALVDKEYTLGGLEDDDFTVGTIAGMEDVVSENSVETSEDTKEATKEDTNVVSMPVADPNSVTLFTKSKQLANAIADKLNLVTFSEDGSTYSIVGQYIRVTRSMAETALEKEITDTQWRMLFIKRDGFNISLNNHEFTMGAPSINDAIEPKTMVQTNIRMETKLRDDMNTYRELLGLSQNDYAVYAIKAMNAQMEEELNSL